MSNFSTLCDISHLEKLERRRSYNSHIVVLCVIIFIELHSPVMKEGQSTLQVMISPNHWNVKMKPRFTVRVELHQFAASMLWSDLKWSAGVWTVFIVSEQRESHFLSQTTGRSSASHRPMTARPECLNLRKLKTTSDEIHICLKFTSVPPSPWNHSTKLLKLLLCVLQPGLSVYCWCRQVNVNRVWRRRHGSSSVWGSFDQPAAARNTPGWGVGGPGYRGGLTKGGAGCQVGR